MSTTQVIYGVNPTIELLRSGRRRCHEIFIAEGRKQATVDKLVRLAEDRKIGISFVKREEMARLTKTEKNQGIAARVDDYPYAVLEEVVANSLSDSNKSFFIILDGITDPQNLGSVIRTAHLLGVSGVIIPRDNSAEVTPAVVKASAGATEYLPVAQVTNIANTINYLKEQGIWVAAAVADSEKSIYNEDFASYSFAIVLGAEGKGVRRLVRERCDMGLNVPMEGRLDSFNVSVAAALIMGEVARQRREANIAKSVPKGG